MEILIAGVLFFVGVFLIAKGGDAFVDASGWVSDVTGISRVVIGATIVSFATTSPELFVSLIATLKGSNDLAIGNAVGSLIANLGIAFAMLATFTYGKVSDELFGIKGIIMILATVLLMVFCINGNLSAIEGIALFIVYIAFTYVNIKLSANKDEKQVKQKTNSKEISINIAKFVLGAAAIIFGSNLIVDNGQIVARSLGVSETVIGLTFVAVGTSLPEIVTSVSAILKKESALSLGNIIGANTLDATLILASCAFVSGGNLSVSKTTTFVDIPVALVLMLIGVIPTMMKKELKRFQGVLMFIVYAIYVVYVTMFRG